MNRTLLTALLATLGTACAGNAGVPPEGQAPPPEDTPPPEAPPPGDKVPEPAPTTATADCLELGRGVWDQPAPPANAEQLPALRGTCKVIGGSEASCDPEQVLSQAVVRCLAGLGDSAEVKLSTTENLYDYKGEPGLTWQVSTGGCGTVKTYHATDGTELSVTHCRRGRPCSIGVAERRAELRRTAGWI